MYGIGWKKPRKERRRAARRMPHQRFQRVQVVLKLGEGRRLVHGRIFLNDLTPDGVGLFIEEPLVRGQSVSHVIEQPEHLYLKGQVAWCGLYTLTARVISVESFRYRVGIRLIFDSAEERAAVRAYCETLLTPRVETSSAA